MAEGLRRAEEYLAAGQDVIWNATSLHRGLRANLLTRFALHHARVRLVYVETAPDRLWDQNAGRDAVVPEDALRRMMTRWEPPDPTEGHEVLWIANGAH